MMIALACAGQHSRSPQPVNEFGNREDGDSEHYQGDRDPLIHFQQLGMKDQGSKPDGRADRLRDVVAEIRANGIVGTMPYLGLPQGSNGMRRQTMSR